MKSILLGALLTVMLCQVHADDVPGSVSVTPGTQSPNPTYSQIPVTNVVSATIANPSSTNCEIIVTNYSWTCSILAGSGSCSPTNGSGTNSNLSTLWAWIPGCGAVGNNNVTIEFDVAYQGYDCNTNPLGSPLNAASGTSSFTVTVSPVTVGITKPIGSLDKTNPISAWLTTPCYHFDFQGVASNSPGKYSLDISGNVNPTPPAGYQWTLDAAAGTLSGDTTASPTHNPPMTAGQGTLTLNATIGTNVLSCTNDQRQVKIYQDHLARDHENFGTGISCGSSAETTSWEFTAFGATIAMENTWNCWGSTIHAYNGSGNGSDPTGAGLDALINQWNSIVFQPPFDWNTINNSLSRGDIISIWSWNNSTEKKPVLQHSHTSEGGATMYAANNEPAFDFTKPNDGASWKWYECTSQQYVVALNTAAQNAGYTGDYVKVVVISKKPIQ